MTTRDFVRSLPQRETRSAGARLRQIHLDPLMLIGLLVVMGFGLVVLYSAADRNVDMVVNQSVRLLLGLSVLVVAAQLPVTVYLRWTPFAYAGGVGLLLLVDLIGSSAKGAQRWLDLPGLPRFQPSELVKIMVPMMVAWYLHDRPLPPGLKDLAVALGIIAVPTGLILIQPDLGTAILVAGAGVAVIVLAGLQWRWMAGAALALALAAPGLWYMLHDYQRQRILTLFDPQSDPLGAGWNIIQSTTAIGSGGVYGKGLFQGTQSHLDFLPESHTDFIIAVIGEELGLVGMTGLLLVYLALVARGLFIAAQAQHAFQRLLAGALTLTFFVYVFVNVGMVSGLLPVVGVPLPLVSYGGTSAITLLGSFGIIMAVRTHRGW
ncbi:MAG: rod shape-determining protein RodA [Pseudomonadales bacterium]|nr:rod shape-determining protein RodA [Pseudomonadales bacterium]